MHKPTQATPRSNRMSDKKAASSGLEEGANIKTAKGSAKASCLCIGPKKVALAFCLQRLDSALAPCLLYIVEQERPRASMGLRGPWGSTGMHESARVTGQREPRDALEGSLGCLQGAHSDPSSPPPGGSHWRMVAGGAGQACAPHRLAVVVSLSMCSALPPVLVLSRLVAFTRFVPWSARMELSLPTSACIAVEIRIFTGPSEAR